MRPTFRLPITIKARPSELIGAFLARTAEENVLLPKQLSDSIRGAAYGTQSRLTRASEAEALARMLFALGEPDLAERPSRPADLTLRHWSPRSFKQVCPACLEADRTITHGLAERCWAACLVHRTAHLTHCPGCRVRLTWAVGSYVHCVCGYDLRFGPLVPVSPDLGELLSAIAHNRAPARPGPSCAPPSDDIWSVRSRLASTFAYFARGLSLSASRIAQESASPTSPFLLLWDEILQVVGDAGSVGQGVRAIETRLDLAGQSKSTAWIKKRNSRRSQLTWKHLADCAAAAAVPRPTVAMGDLQHEAGEDASLSADARRAIDSLPRQGLSSGVRADLEVQIAIAWKSCDIPDLAKARIDEISALADDLRQLRKPAWMDAAFVDIAEILSLIGCGVLTPWGPSFVTNWHVRASEVARIAGEFNLTPCHPSDVGPGTGYSVLHAAVFDARASVSDWLQLSKEKVIERIRRLLPDWLASIRSNGRAVSAAENPRMPFGFGYFLDDPWVGRLAIKGTSAISTCYLLSPHEEVLREALFRAWGDAVAHVEKLEGWGRDCAVATQHLLHECARSGNPIVGTRAAEASTPLRFDRAAQSLCRTRKAADECRWDPASCVRQLLRQALLPQHEVEREPLFPT